MNEKFIELLFKLTDEGYALTISPGIEQNSIHFRMDNCFKAPDRSKALKCDYRTNKELLNYEEFEWLVIDLMLQLEENEKKAGNL